jgi:hypothetical protein
MHPERRPAAMHPVDHLEIAAGRRSHKELLTTAKGF